ncbi:hypothetical protein V5799_018511 [Amblyomma americanum]|uniref:Nucleolar protein 6 n=1 Tax=Amblyomma americanum TaxID=6943 RepID=A0AAQ4EZ95_AMBAM
MAQKAKPAPAKSKKPLPKQPSPDPESEEEFEDDEDFEYSDGDQDISQFLKDIGDDDAAKREAESGGQKRAVDSSADAQSTKKLKKSDLYKPPTAEELNNLKEVETLFHSNLFGLQDKPEALLKKVPLPLPATLPRDPKCRFRFMPPKSVQVVGSQAFGGAVGPDAIVDLALEMPLGPGAFSGFVMTLYLVHLLMKRQLSPMMSSYQAARFVLLTLLGCLSSVLCTVVVHMEATGKWPDDLEALRRVKAAFHLTLARLLRDNEHLVTAARPEHVDVLKVCRCGMCGQ